MNFNSDIKVTGSLSIKKYNDKNKLVEQKDVRNLIVTAGKEFIASRIIDGSIDPMSHMALGGGVTVPMLSNQSLVLETSRVALDSSISSGSTVKYVGVFAPGVSTGSIVEAGLFNSSSAGVMLARTTFPKITKLESESLVIEWTISVG